MVTSALLLSAYDAQSHKLWRQRIVQMFPEIDWTQLTLPPRNFNWRIRSNSLQWAAINRQDLVQSYDLLVATSMVDLSSLRGFVPELAAIPSIIYFHENQFAYPGNLQRRDNIEPLLVPLYAAYCADTIVFNSNYNKTSLLKGARNLFNKLPDKIPLNVLEKIEAARIIPVPLISPTSEPFPNTESDFLEVVWNHRWEYDKGPELLLTISEAIASTSLPIRLHIVGESFREIPDVFSQIKQVLKQHCLKLDVEPGSFGYIKEDIAYRDLLRRCDVVLSTALHEFQGLSIQEACLSGCTPLAPDRLVYPEYLPAEFLYRATDSNADTARLVLQKLRHWLELKEKAVVLPKARLQGFLAEGLRDSYSELFGVSN